MARIKAADHDDKRRRILAGAAELFAGQGFERTSIADIALQCGTSKTLLYHYYAAKEDLLFDIINQHLRELIGIVTHADNEMAAPESRLRLIVGALLEAYRHANFEHKIQVNEFSALPVERQNALRALERQLVDHFAGVIALAVPVLREQRHLLKPVTMSLFGMLNWHYMWFREGGALSREDYADLATRLVLDGAAALAPDSEVGEKPRVRVV